MDQTIIGAMSQPDSHRKGPLLLLLFFLLSLAWVRPVPVLWAQDVDAFDSRLLDDESDSPWEIVADEVSFDQQTETYVARGRVEISRDDKKLSADFVRFNHITYDAEARGHVVLKVGDDLLFGEHLDINLKSQRGHLKDGTIFLADNHFYIQGDRIEKVGDASYRIDGAAVTTCDGKDPDWKITGRKVDVTVEGYGLVQHAALWAREMPVLYSPVMVFPAKRKRQTGLLFPEFGFSDRKGNFYNQPFFWAINDQSDATFYDDYMSERGHKVGAEYRYLIDDDSKGTAMVDYLRDRKEDDGTNSDQYGYTGDDFLRENQNRYWFRMKHDQGLPLGVSARLDLDIVSDQDYLTEFRTGLTGFQETRAYFEDTFGREIDDYTETTRSNELVFSRVWERFSLNAGGVWNDDVVARQNLIEYDTSLHRLPFIEFDAIKQPVFRSPLYWDMANQYDYLYSEDNSQGHRIDLYPRAYLPFRLWRHVAVEPSAGFRQTGWWINNYQENVTGESDKDQSQYRSIYDLRLDTSTEVFNVYHVGATSIDAVRHTLRPRAVYQFIPDKVQDDRPAFFAIDEDGKRSRLNDGINRINRRNRVTYALTQNVTARRKKSGDRAGARDSEASGDVDPEYRYRNLAYFELRQSYDIFAQRTNSTVNRKSGDQKKPFSNINADLELHPTENLRIDGKMQWDPYGSRAVTRNAAVNWTSSRGDELRAEYRYDETKKDDDDVGNNENDVLETLIGSLTVKLPYHLTAYGSYEYDLETDDRIESIFGMRYESQCWAIDVRYTEEEDDKEVAFMIRLVGLGELGTF
ncbi:MAG: LPS assembly protein LptD [Desulfobacterales bacterium]|jgi:LPS-assembly protein